MGRSYVQRGSIPPRYWEPKAGDVVYIEGTRTTIKRVGTSDGTPYVWIRPAVRGTFAMSVANLKQVARVQIPEQGNPRHSDAEILNTLKHLNWMFGSGDIELMDWGGGGHFAGRIRVKHPYAGTSWHTFRIVNSKGKYDSNGDYVTLRGHRRKITAQNPTRAVSSQWRKAKIRRLPGGKVQVKVY